MVLQKISQTTLNEIREAANDRIDFILDELGMDVDKLTGFSDEIRCACPIHGGDNPTAFSYSTTYRRWRCYTNRCHENRDTIFGLAQELLAKKLDREVGFRETVYWLAQKLEIPITGEGTVIEDPDRIEASKLNRETRLRNNIKRRVQSKHDSEKFPPIPIEEIASSIKPSPYFLKQGFTEAILKKYMVGLCEDPRKPMFNRSFVPVLDDTGKMVIGVTGRSIYESCPFCPLFHEKGKGCPKDNPRVRGYVKWQHYGFNSGSVLYNSWHASEHIRKTGVAIVTEGPKDVWWFEQHGVHNSVCIFGLNVADPHLNKLIKIGATTVVVALDNDEKGIEAAEKLNETLGLYFKLVNIKYLLKDGEDIADVSSDRMSSVVVPFLKSLEKTHVS